MNFIKALRRRFFGTPTLNSITKPMMKIMDDLRVFSDEKDTAAKAAEETAKTLQMEAADLRNDSASAESMLKRYSAFVAPVNIAAE